MEIKPQDYRLGNLFNTPKGAGKVTDIIEQGVYFDFENEVGHRFNYDEIKGIELTPEWLERAKFEKVGNNKYAFYYQGVVLFGYWLLDGTVNIGHFIPASIKYVHQLQNLYFSLTGEELAIDKTSLKN